VREFKFLVVPRYCPHIFLTLAKHTLVQGLLFLYFFAPMVLDPRFVLTPRSTSSAIFDLVDRPVEEWTGGNVTLPCPSGR